MNKNSLQIRMMCQSSGHVIVTLYIFIEVIMKISRREQNNRPYIPSYTQALVSFKKYMLPPLPYFKVNICPSPLRLNIFRIFVILSLTQLYRYTPEIFLFTTATFKYTNRAPLRRIGQEYQRT